MKRNFKTSPLSSDGQLKIVGSNSEVQLHFQNYDNNYVIDSDVERIAINILRAAESKALKKRFRNKRIKIK